MSTLNNPTEVTLEDQTKQLLLRMVLEPADKVTQDELRQTGVDIDMLVKTYEQGIRPYLDYLVGYQPLLEQDPLQGSREKLEQWDSELRACRILVPETWEHILLRSGVDTKRTQAVEVVRASLYAYGERHTQQQDCYRMLIILLTRAGKWVVWTKSALHQDAQIFAERVQQFSSIRDMWEGMRAWAVEDYSISFRYSAYGSELKTIPLYIEMYLRRILEGTIESRRDRLSKMESALAAAGQRFAHVGPHH